MPTLYLFYRHVVISVRHALIKYWVTYSWQLRTVCLICFKLFLRLFATILKNNPCNCCRRRPPTLKCRQGTMKFLLFWNCFPKPIVGNFVRLETATRDGLGIFYCPPYCYRNANYCFLFWMIIANSWVLEMTKIVQKNRFSLKLEFSILYPLIRLSLWILLSLPDLLSSM